MSFFTEWNSDEIHWVADIQLNFPKIELVTSCHVGMRFYVARPMLTEGQKEDLKHQVNENFEYMITDHGPLGMWI